MADLQELVKTTYGQGNPIPNFYVSVEDARKLLKEIERLREALADIASMCEQFPSGICYDADCDDTSPEDAAAHTAGLIWQKAKETLGD